MRVTRGKISSRVMKGADSGLLLFNIFISNLEERINSMLMKCTNTKLGGDTNTIEDRNIIQRPQGEMWQEITKNYSQKAYYYIKPRAV